jgi:hypothetical protein
MAKARNTDPETSHEAADSVKEVTLTQEYVMKALRRPRNDIEIVEAYRSFKTAPRASESGIRSRRAELVDSGFVADSGKRVKTPSGRWSIVWERKEK